MSQLTSKQWKTIQSIFDEVIDLPTEKQQERLEQIEADDRLKAEVLSLIKFDRKKLVAVDQSLQTQKAGAKLNQYQLLFPLSTGQHTEVWCGEILRDESKTRERVAIKFLKSTSGEPRRVMRFEQEARFLSNFRHPYISRFLDYGETTEGISYLVTRFVDGENIVAHADHHRLNLDDRVELMVKVCEAIEYAHRFLVVHRDLKPTNIVVTTDGDPVVLDFGISKKLDSNEVQLNLTQTLDRPMTPAYASPEQLRGEPVSVATDIYALGLILYQLVSGHHPYTKPAHDPTTKLFDRISSADPKKPSEMVVQTTKPLLGDEFPQDDPNLIAALRGMTPTQLKKKLETSLDLIVTKAIEKSPEARYSSVANLRKDLQNFLAGKQLTVQRKKASPRNVIRKFPVTATLAATALGLGVGFLFYFAQLKKTNEIEKQLGLERDGIALQKALSTQESRIANESLRATEVSDWSRMSPAGQIRLATLALKQQSFTRAAEVASSLKSKLTELTLDQRFSLANVFQSLGRPANALYCVEQYEQQRDLSFEHKLKLVELLIESGRKYSAQTLIEGDDWPRETSQKEKAEAMVLRAHVRDSIGWTAGAQQLKRKLDDRTLDLLLNVRYRMRFEHLKAICDSENEIDSVIATLPDNPIELLTVKGELQLWMAQNLLDKNRKEEAQALLKSILVNFDKAKLPRHRVAIQAAIMAENAKFSLVDIEQVWTDLKRQNELDSTQGISLGILRIANHEDPEIDRDTFQTVCKNKQVVKESVESVFILQKAWLSFGLANQWSQSANVVKLLIEAYQKDLGDSVEMAYAKAAMAIAARQLEDPQSRKHFDESIAILEDVISKNGTNIAGSFLKVAKNMNWELFVNSQVDEQKFNSATWIYQFMMHRHNPFSDQFEMIVFFLEDPDAANSRDKRELIRFVAPLLLEKKNQWTDADRERWSRLQRVADKLNIELAD